VAQSLSVGENAITITVTAQDGVTTRAYTVTVTRSLDYDSSNIGILEYVPAGRFQRDSAPANISIITQPDRMSRHEITRAQFKAMLGTDPSDARYSTGDSDPVQMVSWNNAIAFCNKLSIAEGLTPVYAVKGIDFSSLTYANIPAGSDPT
jgi:hypothetical protein